MLAPALLLVAAAAAQAQVPAGPEFIVNTYTTGSQRFPGASFARRGDFVVIWTSEPQDGDRSGCFGQRYAADGSRRGAEFQINTYTTFFQGCGKGTVAWRGDSGFVVVWSSQWWQDGSLSGVFGQRFDAAGQRLGAEFQVNSFTTGDQYAPRVAGLRDGGFVVVWTSDGQDGSRLGVFGQRFAPDGSRRGDEFRVNAYTTSFQTWPAIASDQAGRFVVVWDSTYQDGSGSGVYAQRYDSNGQPLGAEFRVNDSTQDWQMHAAVAMAPAGGFVISWTSPQDGSGYGVFARRYEALGTPLASEFQVNTQTVWNQRFSDVAIDAAGNFVVGWQHDDQSTTFAVAQRFDAAGNRRGSEFVAGPAPPEHNPTAMTVASDRWGNLLAAWSIMLSGISDDALARRFGGLLPAALAVDGSGNGVLEPSEAATIATSWQNVNGASLTFGGSARFSGPPGPIYTLMDGAATYGTVANGGTAPCGSDCYAVAITAAARPAVHWDADLLETIVPDSLGQSKIWTLHVGDSFADVLRTSPYYRFVETVLHRGVTAGCGGGAYCAGSTTTREAMAVFVLTAKEGYGYSPPPCGTPMFNDVPASSPYCRWIEELTRRGVVAGCGGGSYCPGQAVSREQMAVFVLRTLDPIVTPSACGVPMFNDVPASSPFCAWIEELARRGVVAGCGGGNYCPAAPVTREQTAVFLTMTFGLELYGL